jgi:hypothetical protein
LTGGAAICFREARGFHVKRYDSSEGSTWGATLLSRSRFHVKR